MNESKLISIRLAEITDLSSEDIEQIRKLLLDFFAAACAGYKLNTAFNMPVEEVILKQEGIGESSVLFCKKKIPARSAAFLNSLYGHGAELDDGNRKAMGHVGVHIIPAVLALAEAEEKSQAEIMIAVAVGYEAYIRISSAAQPGMVTRSFHSTGTAGAIGCAAACAKLLRLDAEGIENAMSLACTMSSGLLTYTESRQMIKPLNPAKAAETGIFSARLVEAGVKGPLNCLEGPNGWFHAMADEVHENMILREMNGSLLIHDCYFKLYPSCRHTHCGIEAAINLSGQINYKTIEKIEVYIYPNAIRLAGQIPYPQNPDETKFSIQYTLACALFYGEYGVDFMHPDQIDKMVEEIIGKIVLIPDESMENRQKGIRGSHIKIIFDSGKSVEETVLIPKGDPEKPLTTGDIIRKFTSCSKGLLTSESSDEFIKYILSFGGSKPLDAEKLFMQKEKV